MKTTSTERLIDTAEGGLMTCQMMNNGSAANNAGAEDEARKMSMTLKANVRTIWEKKTPPAKEYNPNGVVGVVNAHLQSRTA
ncbi:hypothetical protein DIPPA_19896 [Diplonema papillatum]|nr:hypothetical protein DIPPA_01160 [Diplonema papillatum]KAJ9461608.1 hypothetical protein DIPPA_19896 [Diplonema papillatum]